jgi:hypothetical protein
MPCRIDLAAEIMNRESYFLAAVRLQDLSPKFSVDLVDMARCQPALREALAMEGTPL